jgi:thiol-disulfide isomerase/thioredoxin
MLRFIYMTLVFSIGIGMHCNAVPNSWDALISLRQQCEPQCQVQWSDPPEELLNITWEGEKGRRLLEEEEGHPVLLHFWAPWCTSCVAEMPMLDELAKALTKQGYAVVAVSVDYRGLPVIKDFYTKHAIEHLSIGLDPKNQLYEQLKLKGMPVTLIIDRQGNEVARLAGNIDWQHVGLKEWLLALTKPPI